MPNRLTTQEFIQKARKIHGDKYDYSKVNYTNSQTKVEIICPKHGSFLQIPNNHLQGAGCLKCKHEYVANLQRSSKEEFIIKANKVHNNFYNYSRVIYGKNNKEKVIIICPKHGEFLQTPHDHLSGCGCPKCKLKAQTKLYEKLKQSFPNVEILFETGKEIKWLEGQRFDIYFPKYNIAVEYNGQQHYIPIKYYGGKLLFEKTKKLDNLKELKCQENNCSLFKLKYNYTEEDYYTLTYKINNIIKSYETRSKKS